MKTEFTIPMKTKSLANERLHWRAKAEVTKRQRKAAMLKCPKWPAPLLVITVTRVSPRELDPHDNLPSALKPTIDGVAARLRIDDRSSLVRWEYAQEKCSAGQECVRVSIRTVWHEDAAPDVRVDAAVCALLDGGET